MFAPAYQSFSYRNTEATMKPKPKVETDVVVKRYNPRARARPGSWREQWERAWAKQEREMAEREKRLAQRMAALDEAIARAKEAAQDAIDEAQIGVVLVRDIIHIVASKHGFTAAQILGPRRSKALVIARHEAICEAARLRPDMSLPELGRQFRRDHTTILHALQKAGMPSSREARQHTDRET